MASSVIEATTIHSLFLAFLPGILAFVIYRSSSDKDFGKIDKLDYLIIIFFTLLVESTRSVLPNPWTANSNLILYYLVSGAVLGFISDIGHRIYLNYPAKWYDEILIPMIGTIENTDTAETARWNTVLNENTPYNMEHLGKTQYIEVDTEEGQKSGFLVGFSSSDVEIMNYDKIEKNIAGREFNTEDLKRRTEIISKDKTSSLRIFNIQFKEIIDLDN